MHLVIYEPSTDVTLVSRLLAGDELLDCLAHAEAYAAQMGQELEAYAGHVPSFAGDIRVEFRDDPAVTWHIWTGESFYFKRDEF